MIEKEELKKYANKLMFDMENSEYETLQKEFETILKQMELIGKIDGIEKVEPMTFPFIANQATWRKDEIKDTLSTSDVLKNAKSISDNTLKVPKVVE